MHRPKLYVAGKFTDFTEDKPLDQRIGQEESNRRSAQQTARRLWDIGFRVIVPHSMTGLPTPTATRQSSIDVDREAVLQTCLEILAECDALYFMRNGKRSSRANREQSIAQRLNMPVVHNYEEARQYLERTRESRRAFFPKKLHSNGSNTTRAVVNAKACHRANVVVQPRTING